MTKVGRAYKQLIFETIIALKLDYIKQTKKDAEQYLQEHAVEIKDQAENDSYNIFRFEASLVDV